MITKQKNSGQAMLAAVMFLIFAALAVIAGTAAPVLRDRAVERTGEQGKQSLYAAESGVEDVAYRLKNNISVTNNESLSVNGATAITTTANSLNGKIVTAAGDLNDLVRRLSATLQLGTGVSFSYALQTGTGGLNMSNSSGIIGNVYSQGDIVGANGAFITGSAYAANSIDPTPIESHQGNSPPTQTITFGNTSGNQDLAQSFKVGSAGPLTQIAFLIKKVGNPGNLTARLTTSSNGSPAASSLDMTILSAGNVGSDFYFIPATFSGQATLNPNTTYWLVLDGSNSSANYYLVGADTNYATGTAKTGAYGNSWASLNPSNLSSDFEVFTGGDFSSISAVNVGQNGVGDAWAHTVNNSTIAGNLYCQSGTGNNKACSAAQGPNDPAPQPFPISDANIATWKNDAATSWTLNGDLNLSGSQSTTTGPLVITGDLDLANTSVLTITGTIYVKGNVNLSNSAIVRLAPGYGANGGVLVADGRVNVANTASFNGSGQSGSYLLVVTTSSCPSNNCESNAIDIANNAGTVVLNAQKGTISFSNNAGTKEATAKKIFLSNSATVTYDSGLANYNFMSGPTGGFNLSNWGETQ